MNTSTIIEAVGYLGSGLVLVSFLMSSVVKLRVVNTAGSLIFALYALIIRSYPTALMNVCLVLINLHFLWRLRRDDPSYRLVALAPGEGYVSKPASQDAPGGRKNSTAPSLSATGHSAPASCSVRSGTGRWTLRSTTPRPPTATARWGAFCWRTSQG